MDPTGKRLQAFELLQILAHLSGKMQISPPNNKRGPDVSGPRFAQ